MSITRFSLQDQWGHVGSELIRGKNRLDIGDRVGYQQSMERTLDMLGEMISDHQQKKRRLRELCLFKEIVLSSFIDPSLQLSKYKMLTWYCNEFVKKP